MRGRCGIASAIALLDCLQVHDNPHNTMKYRLFAIVVALAAMSVACERRERAVDPVGGDEHASVAEPEALPVSERSTSVVAHAPSAPTSGELACLAVTGISQSRPGWLSIHYQLTASDPDVLTAIQGFFATTMNGHDPGFLLYIASDDGVGLVADQREVTPRPAESKSPAEFTSSDSVAAYLERARTTRREVCLEGRSRLTEISTGTWSVRVVDHRSRSVTVEFTRSAIAWGLVAGHRIAGKATTFSCDPFPGEPRQLLVIEQRDERLQRGAQ